MSNKVLKIGSCCYFCGASDDTNITINLGNIKKIACQRCIEHCAKPGIITSISPSLLKIINERLRFVNDDDFKLPENAMIDLCADFMMWLHKTMFRRPVLDLDFQFDYPAEEEPTYHNLEFILKFLKDKDKKTHKKYVAFKQAMFGVK